MGIRALVGLVAGLAVAGSGCATKKYVSKEVGAVNQKVETLSEAVEKNQERIRVVEGENQRQDGEIKSADAKAASAGSLAGEAKGDAAKAFGEAQRAMKGKLIYEVTLSNDKVRFSLNAAELADEARAMIDDLANKIKADNRGLWIEVEGHTDNTGDEGYNQRLGLERAEAVRNYLYQSHGIPLHRISVFSFGETQPVAENANRDGRAQNRRVVIKVLE